MSVKIVLRKKEYFVEGGITVEKALEQLGLPPESYLAVRNGEMITERELLRDGDEVKLVAVISGGGA